MDRFGKEGRNFPVETIYDDANTTLKFRLRKNTVKKVSQVCEINANRDLTRTINSLLRS